MNFFCAFVLRVLISAGLGLPTKSTSGEGSFLSSELGRGAVQAVGFWVSFGFFFPLFLQTIILSMYEQFFPIGIGSLAASYLNPVKSFVPQMPKLLKSLFPVRDEKKGRQSSPLAQQSCFIKVVAEQTKLLGTAKPRDPFPLHPGAVELLY
ncbi:hypothetical protein DV515_00013049 [Chloebia gouldiae]|uniref:Uncharacterized protein n=1 Tax=Chloebia gouldiae TaxID=44316 RepID=A0A3L8S2X6_CHLGU|nr:hypothetical protein DV515_00013049 [Chloebia gouldiae]